MRTLAKPKNKDPLKKLRESVNLAFHGTKHPKRNRKLNKRTLKIVFFDPHTCCISSEELLEDRIKWLAPLMEQLFREKSGTYDCKIVGHEKLKGYDK